MVPAEHPAIVVSFTQAVTLNVHLPDVSAVAVIICPPRLVVAPGALAASETKHSELSSAFAVAKLKTSPSPATVHRHVLRMRTPLPAESSIDFYRLVL